MDEKKYYNPFIYFFNSSSTLPMIIANRSTIDSEIHYIVSFDKYFIVPQSKSFQTTSNLNR